MPYVPPHLRQKVAPEPEPVAEDRGYLVPALATGLRVVGPAVGSVAGGVLGTAVAPGAGTAAGAIGGGALGGGAGEYLAQLLEGRGRSKQLSDLITGEEPEPINLKRIAVSSALGAVPGSWMVRSGKPLASAAIGAGLGYAGTAGYKAAEGEELGKALDPREWSGSDILTGPALGGAIGGGIGKITGPKKAPAPKPVAPKVYEVETTSQPGGRVVTGGKISTDKRSGTVTKGGRLETVKPIQPITASDIELPTAKAPAATPYPTKGPVPANLPKPAAAKNPDGTVMSEAQWRAAVDKYNKSQTATPAPAAPAGVKSRVPYGVGETPVSKVAAKTAERETAAQEVIRQQLGKNLDKAGAGAKDKLKDLDAAIKAEQQAAAKARATSGRVETQAVRQEAAADLAQMKAQQAAEENARKLASIEAKKEGLEPTPYTVSESESAVTADKKRVSASRRFRTPTEADDVGEGGGGGESVVGPKKPKAQVFTSKDAAKDAAIQTGGTDVVKLGRGKYQVVYASPEPVQPSIPGVEPIGGKAEPLADVPFTLRPETDLPSGAQPDLAPVEPAAPKKPTDIEVARAKKAGEEEFRQAQQRIFKESGEKLKKVIEPSPAAIHIPGSDVPPTPPPAAGPKLVPKKPKGPAGGPSAQAAPEAPTSDIPESVFSKRFKSKKEAETVAKAVGGEVHQDGPRQFSIRSKAPVEPEPITPTPTIKLPEPRPAAPSKPRTGGGEAVGGGRVLPPEPTTSLGQFDPGKLTTEEFRRFNQIRPMIGRTLTDAEKAEYLALAKKRVGEATPEDAVQAMQDMAKTANKDVPLAAPKFPTAKIQGAELPAGQQTNLLGETDEATDLFQKMAQEAPEAPVKPPVTEGGAIPARMFKSRLEAAKEGYGDIKAAKAAGEAVPEEGRSIAGRNAQREKKLAEGGKPAEKAPKGDVTSDDLAKMSPEEQEKALKELIDRFKGQKGAIDPALLIRGGMTAAGAATGAAMDPEDRLRGALLGGAAGFGAGVAAGKAPVVLGKLGQTMAGDEALDQKLAKLISGRASNYIRGALLSDPRSIGINAIAGPAGSNFWGGVEEYMKGAVSGDAARAAGGKQVIRGVTTNLPTWMKKFFSNFEKAKTRLHDVEESGRAGSFNQPGGYTMWDKAVETPATWMLTGDLTAGEHFTAAGIPESLMRKYTLTAEPQRALWRGVTLLTKALNASGTGTATISKIMLPFVRTAANIMETGTERTPILGWAINRYGDPKLRVSGADVVIQQSIGVVAMGLGFAAGLAVSPDMNSTLKIRNLVSNLGGPYSLLSGAGFAAGQAIRAGKDPVNAVQTEFLGGMPLPTTRPVADVLKTTRKGLSGELGPEDIANSMFVPKLVDFLRDMAGGTGLGIPIPGMGDGAAAPATEAPSTGYIPPHLR